MATDPKISGWQIIAFTITGKSHKTNSEEIL